MQRPESESDRYLVAHIREKMAQDPRVNELELEIQVTTGRKVFIMGTVPTRERQQAISEVARELLPDHEIHNQTTVQVLAEGQGAETIG